MIKWAFIILLLLVTNSCDKVTPRVKSCSIEGQNEFVYNLMQDRYLWNTTLPTLDYKNYSSPEKLLNDLKNSKDKWSFIIDTKTLNQYFNEGKYIGIGIKFTKKDNDIYISMVYRNSPANNAGITRGMKLISINSKLVSNMTSQEIHDAFGENKIGVKVDLELESGNQINNYTLYKKEIQANSVITSKIIQNGNDKIGYIVFDKFVEFSNSELDNAFANFKNNGVNKLIIDLRYNGGGLLSVAQHLASLIHPDNGTFVNLQFNANNSYKNSSYNYQNLNNSLQQVSSIYFITTNATCSASEAVINGLKPYINDITIIGKKTCGKPVGMVGADFCGKSILPIEFKLTNLNGYGNYFGGITPTCYANDDLTHNFGDTNETMLKATINYINNNTCNTQSNRLMRVVTNKQLKLYGMHKITGAF